MEEGSQGSAIPERRAGIHSPADVRLKPMQKWLFVPPYWSPFCLLVPGPPVFELNVCSPGEPCFPDSPRVWSQDKQKPWAAPFSLLPRTGTLVCPGEPALRTGCSPMYPDPSPIPSQSLRAQDSHNFSSPSYGFLTFCLQTHPDVLSQKIIERPFRPTQLPF